MTLSMNNEEKRKKGSRFNSFAKTASSNQIETEPRTHCAWNDPVEIVKFELLLFFQVELLEF